MMDAKSEYPHIRKTGRYLFYAVCAFGCGLLASMALLGLGLQKDWAVEAVLPVFFVAFLALRDLEKNAERRALEDRP